MIEIEVAEIQVVVVLEKVVELEMVEVKDVQLMAVVEEVVEVKAADVLAMRLYLFKKFFFTCCKVDILLPHGLARAFTDSFNLLQFVQQPARAVHCSHLRLLTAAVTGGKGTEFSGLDNI